MVCMVQSPAVPSVTPRAVLNVQRAVDRWLDAVRAAVAELAATFLPVLAGTSSPVSPTASMTSAMYAAKCNQHEWGLARQKVCVKIVQTLQCHLESTCVPTGLQAPVVVDEIVVIATPDDKTPSDVQVGPRGGHVASILCDKLLQRGKKGLFKQMTIQPSALTPIALQVKVAPEGGRPKGATKPGIPPQTVKVQGRDVTIAPADAKSRPSGKTDKDSGNTKASGSASGSQQKVQCDFVLQIPMQSTSLCCSRGIVYIHLQP